MSGAKGSVVVPLDPCEPVHQRDRVMKASGLIDQLLNVHGDLDAFRHATSQDAGLGRAGEPGGFVQLLQISLRQTLMASLIAAVFMSIALIDGSQYRSKRGRSRADSRAILWLF